MKKHHDVRITLYDMLEAIKLCTQFTSGISFDEFQNNWEKVSATMYQIMIVGEAVTRLPSEVRTQNPHIPWSRIKGMRNVLAHHYEDADLSRVWLVVTEHLPQLKIDIQNILDPKT